MQPNFFSTMQLRSGSQSEQGGVAPGMISGNPSHRRNSSARMPKRPDFKAAIMHVVTRTDIIDIFAIFFALFCPSIRHHFGEIFESDGFRTFASVITWNIFIRPLLVYQRCGFPWGLIINLILCLSGDMFRYPYLFMAPSCLHALEVVIQDILKRARDSVAQIECEPEMPIKPLSPKKLHSQVIKLAPSPVVPQELRVKTHLIYIILLSMALLTHLRPVQQLYNAYREGPRPVQCSTSAMSDASATPQESFNAPPTDTKLR